VQEAIEQALKNHGLHVDFVDHGFDFEVTWDSDASLEELAMRFLVGSYLVEVKATTIGDACLTPTQASTASDQSDRYVLCVVDLRAVPEERLDQEWNAADVEPLAKVVPTIGKEVSSTVTLVELARDNDVGLRNEGALRYRVPPAVWEKGVSIAAWAANVSTKLTPVENATTVPAADS
jgi:hypothetical protein